MHLTRRTLPVFFILALAASAAGGKTPQIVFDAGNVSGRDILSRKVGRKKTRFRTGRYTEAAALQSASPDGRRIAFLLTPPGIFDLSDLVVAKAAKGRGRRITESLDGQVTDTEWTADSRYLVFTHLDRVTGRTDVWRVNGKGKKLTNLTAALEGDLATGPGTVFTVGEGLAAVNWEFPDRPDVVLLDVTGRTAPRRVSASLPDGAGAGTLHFSGSAAFFFTWLPEGGAFPRLYRLTDEDLTLTVAGVSTVQRIAAGAVALDQEGFVHVVRDDAITTYDTLGEAQSCRAAPPGYPVTAVVNDPLRILKLDVDPLLNQNLLPGHTLEAVERVLFADDDIVLRIREDGRRKLFVLDPATPSGTQPVAGMEHSPGAFLDLSPDRDLVLFSMVSPADASGEIMAWSRSRGTLTNLTGLAGISGTPGSATASAATGDVLFNMITLPDADNLLFLWERGPNRVVPISDPAHRTGRFLFSR